MAYKKRLKGASGRHTRKLMAFSPFMLPLFMAISPHLLLLDGDFISDLKNFFTQTGVIIWVVYYGLIGLIFGIYMVKTMREIIPAMLKGKDEDPQFNKHMFVIVRALAVLLLACLAPIWVPALISMFGGDTTYLTVQSN